LPSETEPKSQEGLTWERVVQPIAVNLVQNVFAILALQEEELPAMSDRPEVSELMLRWQQEPTLSAEELCAGCPELLNEVRRRIQALRSMEAMPAGPVSGDDLGSTMGPSPAGAAAAPIPGAGADIPGYEILCVLGRGGQSVVYQARHLQLNRVVALKVILAGGHASAEDHARLRTEAEAIARL